MHRRVPTSLLIALIVALGGASLATAQGGPAALGTPVTIVDPEGIIRGEVTVREMVDPFTEHEPTAPPPEGMRYVLLVTTFQAALDQQLDAQPYQVVLQDTDGYLYSTQYIPRPADAVMPDLQGQLMAPDNRISGAITFHVPTDATIDRVVYQPSFDRFVELADVTPGTGPALGDATTYTDALGASTTVSTQLIDPFTAIDPAYPPAEGMRVRGARSRSSRTPVSSPTTPTRTTSSCVTRVASCTTSRRSTSRRASRSRPSKPRR